MLYFVIFRISSGTESTSAAVIQSIVKFHSFIYQTCSFTISLLPRLPLYLTQDTHRGQDGNQTPTHSQCTPSMDMRTHHKSRHLHSEGASGQTSIICFKCSLHLQSTTGRYGKVGILRIGILRLVSDKSDGPVRQRSITSFPTRQHRH